MTTRRKTARKRVLVNGRYMRVRQRTTSKGEKGTIIGPWRPPRKKPKFPTRIFALACISSFMIGVVLTYGALRWSILIPTFTKVKTVGISIYQDLNFTRPVTLIDWGTLEPGESKNYSAYIVNESNVPVTLSLYTENWNPANASVFVTLSWDYDAPPVDVDGFVEVTFTLTVDPAVSGIETFSFDIVIVGSG